MEYEKIKELIHDMGNSKLHTLDITFPDGTMISMKKENTNEKIIEDGKVDQKTQVVEKVKEDIDKIEGNVVKSPMVGTFYLKPNPTASPFVSVGDEVSVGDTLCIIEAMKLMNEIESEFSGKITKILVEDETPVEYGTPLFLIS